MAAINKKELKGMNEEDLKNRFKDLKTELIKENAQIAVGTTPKSPGQVKQIKKSIARIIQLLNKKDKEVRKDKWVKFVHNVDFQKTFVFVKQ